MMLQNKSQDKIFYDRSFNHIIIYILLIAFVLFLYFAFGSDVSQSLITFTVLIGFLVFTRPFQGFVYFIDSIMIVRYSIFKSVIKMDVQSLIDLEVSNSPRDSFLVLKTKENNVLNVHLKYTVIEKIIEEIDYRKYIDKSFVNTSIFEYKGYRIKVILLTILCVYLFLMNLSLYTLTFVCVLQIFEFYESTNSLLFSRNNHITLAAFDLPESITFKKTEVESLDFLKIGSFIFPRCRFSLKDGSVIRFKVDNYKKLIELINSNSETPVNINFKWFNWFKFSNVKSRLVS